ncbi:MAG: hypothetical protein ACREKL_11605 [Chthoniobacterales bacterium]
MDSPIAITPLSRTDARDWDSLRRSFRGKPTLELGQSWLDQREPLFAAGHVRVALSGMSLAIFATLRDRDVFNPVTHFNTPAFAHGDTFEILLQPHGQTAYYEFHITPDATLLQLRWPQPMRSLALDWSAAADPLLAYKITRWRVRAKARLARHGWEVHAEIPLQKIFESDTPWNGSHLLVNFARYDHTRGRIRPVLSATAPLSKPDFHRTAEWQALELRFR